MIYMPQLCEHELDISQLYRYYSSKLNITVKYTHHGSTSVDFSIALVHTYPYICQDMYHICFT